MANIRLLNELLFSIISRFLNWGVSSVGRASDF